MWFENQFDKELAKHMIETLYLRVPGEVKPIFKEITLRVTDYIDNRSFVELGNYIDDVDKMKVLLRYKIKMEDLAIEIYDDCISKGKQLKDITNLEYRRYTRNLLNLLDKDLNFITK